MELYTLSGEKQIALVWASSGKLCNWHSPCLHGLQTLLIVLPNIQAFSKEPLKRANMGWLVGCLVGLSVKSTVFPALPLKAAFVHSDTPYDSSNVVGQAQGYFYKKIASFCDLVTTAQTAEQIASFSFYMAYERDKPKSKLSRLILMPHSSSVAPCRRTSKVHVFCTLVVTAYSTENIFKCS